jgi:hypothetical protein
LKIYKITFPDSCGETPECEDITEEDVTGNAGVAWSSSNTAVATVNNSGVVSGLTVGESIISVSVNSELEDQLAMSVVASTTPDDPTPNDPTPNDPTPDEPTPNDPTSEDIYVVLIFNGDETAITIDMNTYAIVGSQGDIDMGDNVQFEAKICNLKFGVQSGNYLTINRSTCADATAAWSSSDTSVLTINETGLGTIKGVGRTVITAKVDGHEDSTLTYIVTETEIVETYTWLRLFIIDSKTTQVTYNGTSRPTIDRMLNPGETLQLKAIVCKDSDATVNGTTRTWDVNNCREVSAKWSTNNTSSITVSDSGLVTAKKGGYNWENIFATVDESTLGLAANEKLDGVHNEVIIYVAGAEYKKNGVNSETVFVSDVATTDNPPTGNYKYLAGMTLGSIVIGGRLVFKRKRVSIY